MILLTENQASVFLQIIVVNPDGSVKTDVSDGFVRVYSLSTGAEVVVLTSTALVRVGATNVWRYFWSPTTLPVDNYVAEYTLTDSKGLVTVVAEDLVVKDIATESSVSDLNSLLVLVKNDLEIVRKVETGRWKISGNSMTFYDDDDVTPVLVFDLKDEAGVPSMDNVFERTPQ